MNPYAQLSKLAGVFSLSAILRKRDGRVLNLYVKPEARAPEKFGATVQAALAIREWVCNVNDLIVGEETCSPEAGDVLTVTFDDGSSVSYECARDSVSGRYWEWQYLRRGYRVKFYTKYNPKETT